MLGPRLQLTVVRCGHMLAPSSPEVPRWSPHMLLL
jgi:hypothetical protein